MRIHRLDHHVDNDTCRVSATVTWEDCDRPERQLYIDSDVQYAGDLWPNPNAFLLAAIIPAMMHGERRLKVEASVCPQLRNGLDTVMQQLCRWYGPVDHERVTIEATQGFEPARPRSPQRIASFMSGGVDAITTLYCNRADFPLGHAGSIQDGFIVHGIDVGGYEDFDKNEEHFGLAVESLSELARESHLNLIPLFTNFRHLDDSDALFALEAHGAIFAAIAHMFSRRITSALLASTMHVQDLRPWGSHPLLDPNYSSCDMQFLHDGARLTRLEKISLIVNWDGAMQHLRSCYHTFRPGDVLNCGKCEKCLRTMTELISLGKFDRCQTFPISDVSPEMIHTLQAEPKIPPGVDLETLYRQPPIYLADVNADHWRQLAGPLRDIGRHDLAAAVDAKITEFERYRARIEERDWRGKLKRFDRRFLNRTLARMKGLINRR